MRRAGAALAVTVLLASSLAACSDDVPPPEGTATAPPTPEPTALSGDAGPSDVPTESAEVAPAGTGPGSGTASVEVGDQSFDFRVIQCLRDVPGLLGGVVAFQLDGVPVDAPSALVEPLVGVADPDSDIFELMDPVLEYGPILSVTRLEGGGDYVAVLLGGGDAYVSDGATSDDRYLTIGEEPEGASVTGETTVNAGQDASVALNLEASCP